jgi:voltage-gated potassium channel
MHEHTGGPRRVLIALTLLAVVIVASTLGYVVIERWSWFDSLYMTILTISTTGGGEAGPLSLAGRWFTLIVIVVGFGVMAYTLLALVGYVLEGQIGRAFEARRMRRAVQRMRDHFILCGYGRVGREIAEEFRGEGVPFVIIDINADSLERAASDGFMVVHGNASDVAVLRQAGIDDARGLVTAVDSDPDNIYVTLSARVLRPNLFIVARANQSDAEPKLRLAGANRILSPYTIGGRRMAALAMRPTAVEFVDTVLQAGNSELLLEDMTIPGDSQWVGNRLAGLVGDDRQVIVLAIKRGESMVFGPSTDTALMAGDELVAAGPRQSILALANRLQRATGTDVTAEGR